MTEKVDWKAEARKFQLESIAWEAKYRNQEMIRDLTRRVELTIFLCGFILGGAFIALLNLVIK
jgi:hypothetical protein